jgi:predicted RNA-binding Zn ribbon-like protein
MSTSSPVTPAPGELEFVRVFVNTLDVEAGTDELEAPDLWRRWTGAHGMDERASAADLAFARRVREALRAGMLANHDRQPLPPDTVDALNEAAERVRLAVRFSPDGTRVEGSGSGMNAVLARLLSAVASALSDGTWARLKVCAADDCRWGFYDSSRSRTGQWCSMSICGNRAKQARFRQNVAHAGS